MVAIILFESESEEMNVGVRYGLEGVKVIKVLINIIKIKQI